MKSGQGTVGGDHLSFKDIARGWSKVAGETPELLMEELIKAFWLGTFERDGHFVLFRFLPPDLPCVERRPGNYPTRAGSVDVKVAEDGHSYPTRERQQVSIVREVVAYFFCRPDWRGITAEHPTGFDSWSDEQRDAVRPNWRVEYEDSYIALSNIPFNQWSPDLREDHYSQWRIERGRFAGWYKTSPLSAGVGLEKFWPKVAQTAPGAAFRHRRVR